ncbi:hypothetical protein INT46_000528 [Mucor plumbeus]|uniref:Uncharacterized protein n=1 Tax=Mucor plumbeus TaxID=97098 RepID=A0A8H7UPQ6_9FUNG|nr:hypothetical protein INT46_000528 [Mucor plumbeus]
MRIALTACSLIVFVYATEIHQDFANSVDTNQDEDKPAFGLINHPYVGIPVGAWKIIDSNATEIDTICNEQQTFCSNECGGQDLTLINFCNRSTVAWNCKCKNHVPDTPPYRWPATIAECHGKETTCNNGCSYGITKAICSKACNQYYKCNQAGSPPSGLQVENEYNIPNYNIVTENTGIHSPLNASIAFKLHVSSFIQLVVTPFFIGILQIFLIY